VSRGRVLVVADDVLRSHDQLPEEVESALQQAESVYVIAPALNSRLAALCDDDERARHEADERLHDVLDFLRTGEHVEAGGEVGDGNPLQAITDALVDFPADEIILAVHAGKGENWREHHLVDKVARYVEIPTTVVRVEAAG